MTLFNIRKLFSIAYMLIGSLFVLKVSASQPEVAKHGNRLYIEALMPDGVNTAEIRIISNRNKNISSFREISPNNPNPDVLINSYTGHPRDIWYPVVDIKLQRGMRGVAAFSNTANAHFILNGPFYKEKKTLSEIEIFPAGILHEWENSVLVEPETVQMTGFYITMQCPVIAGKVVAEIELLSPQWDGIIELFAMDGNLENKVATVTIKPEFFKSPVYEKTSSSLGKERLLKALEGSLGFTLRSQVRDNSHPANGGLYLFYDLDARLYRSYHWVWGWGPSVSLLLQSAELFPDIFDSKNLQKVASEIGETSLRFIWNDPSSPVHKMMISRWDRGIQWTDGYAGAVTPADALFMAGWAWVPLYKLTGDNRYLEATRWQCEKTDSLFNHWIIPPHSYYFDKEGWSDWVIDETGFGMEGYARLYQLTNDEQLKTSGKQYIDRHCKVFEQENGLWGRNYFFKTLKLVPSQHMTRGMAWAFEGLIAAHSMLPTDGYLTKARRMADQLLQYQLPNGAWSFRYNQTVEKTGYSEKGTAAWSYFLYQLYHYTQDEKYLISARNALLWCLNSMYDGPDAEANGSITGCSEQSGVGYRRWFTVSCTYTSAFFGLAILEELKQQLNP